MNVIIDGIRINRITDIRCNADTNYMTLIEFQIDDRIKNTTDPNLITSFEVQEYRSKDEEIDYAIIMIPNGKDITNVITRDNKS